MSIDFNQLREFLKAIAQTAITDLTIKEGDFELNIRKEVYPSVAHTLPPPLVPMVKAEERPISPEKESPPPAEATAATAPVSNWVEITSPMVGTFYRASAPGEAPFVSVGDHIVTGQVVCIIEAMKLMNEIETEVAGQVMEIAVENGEPVEYGQTLMWINPN